MPRILRTPRGALTLMLCLLPAPAASQLIGTQQTRAVDDGEDRPRRLSIQYGDGIW
jgi:hypothetical protein